MNAKTKKTKWKCVSKSGTYAEAKTTLTVSFAAATTMERKFSGGRSTLIEIREVIVDGVYSKTAVSCATGMNYPSSFEDLEIFTARLQEIVAITNKALKETFLLKAEVAAQEAFRKRNAANCASIREHVLPKLYPGYKNKKAKVGA